MTAKGQQVGAVVCVHAKGMKEPWCLASQHREATRGGASDQPLRQTLDDRYRPVMATLKNQGLRGWQCSTGGGKRRQGGGVARIVLRLAIVAASAVTNFAEPAPALTERLRRRPFCTQL